MSSSELIDYGIVTFDHIGAGLLTIFQTITLEGWTKIMYNYMDSNITAMAVIFFCLLVVFGYAFLYNSPQLILPSQSDSGRHHGQLRRERGEGEGARTAAPANLPRDSCEGP